MRIAGERLDRPADQIVRSRGGRYDEALPHPGPVVPPIMAELVRDALSIALIGQSLSHRLDATLLHPRRQMLSQGRRRCIVRINVKRNVDITVSKCMKPFEHAVRRSPVTRLVDCQVRILETHSCLRTNGCSLFDCARLAKLTARMSCIEPAV